MKSLYITLFVVLFISCNSDDDPIPVDYKAENEKEIMDYITLHDLDATRTNSGLYYVVDEVGEGVEISATSDVSMRFKGFYTDGANFDENTEGGISFNLQEVIAGLREGLQYFNEGGSGTILIPSHLAFGSQDTNGVPGGSVLIFEIDIIDYDVENKQEIINYITENNLDAVESETGLFYIIEEQGTGDHPNDNSNVTVVYKGYFTNGAVFDESNASGTSLNLNQVIPGWKEGLQYFNEGGHGILLIPSSLGYGRYGNQSIPGGAVLIFEVDLKLVN